MATYMLGFSTFLTVKTKFHFRRRGFNCIPSMIFFHDTKFRWQLGKCDFKRYWVVVVVAVKELCESLL